VVVTPSDELDEEGPIFVVAITTTLPDPLPDDHVPIPWQRPRHPRTGLNERNAAVCHWLASVELDRIDRVIGLVPNAELARIEEALRRLADES
jgi:mRNA-degrading endonuclease toxin of MazEF toxin-antitoxin module